MQGFLDESSCAMGVALHTFLLFLCSFSLLISLLVTFRHVLAVLFRFLFLIVLLFLFSFFPIQLVLLFRLRLRVVFIILVSLRVFISSIFLFARKFFTSFRLEIETQNDQKLEHVKDY